MWWCYISNEVYYGPQGENVIKYLFFLVGLQLLGYNCFTVLCFCCTTKWSQRIYTNIPRLDLWPLPPSHPSGSPQSTRLSFLSHAEASRWLFIYMVVHICRSQSPSTRPHSPLPRVYMPVLCVWPWHLPGLSLSGLSTVATWHLYPLERKPYSSETFWKPSALSLI